MSRHLLAAGAVAEKRGNLQSSLAGDFVFSRLEQQQRRTAFMLHDGPVQSLSAAGAMLHRAAERGDEQAVRTCIAAAEGMIEQAADELRQIMCELRPAALEDHDLAEMLEGYVHQFRLTCRTRVEFSASGHAPHVGPEARVAVLRIVQEALSNARRHAHANLIAVALEPDDDRICCSIADDGIGFASERPVRPSGQHHWGLASMSDRAALVGGEIEVRSAPGEGTRVTVRIPLPGS